MLINGWIYLVAYDMQQETFKNRKHAVKFAKEKLGEGCMVGLYKADYGLNKWVEQDF